MAVFRRLKFRLACWMGASLLLVGCAAPRPPVPQPAERVIRTPWGELRPQVDMLPVLYLLVLYGLVWFLPFGVFESWRKGEDGPAEWLQFIGYAGAAATVWACIIPALLAKKSRELAPDEAGFKAPGGQPMVVAVIVFGVLTAIFHLMAMAGLLPVYTG